MRRILPIGIVGIAALAFGIGAFLWMGASPSQIVHEFLADPSNPVMGDKLRSADEAAIPALFDQLAAGADSQAVLAGFRELTSTWPVADSRWDRLADRLQGKWTAMPKSTFSAGVAIVAQAFRVNQPPPSENWLKMAFALLESHGNQTEIGAGRFILMQALIPHASTDRHRELLRQLAKLGVADSTEEGKIAAIRFTAQEKEPDPELIEKSANLLRDPSAIVRRAVLLHFGSRSEVIAEQDLLPMLHDSDTESQGLAMLALRGRGLGDQEIMMARFISDGRPAHRLRVLDLLTRHSELDTGVWLNRLSHDPSPAVRAAAMRAAVQMDQVDFAARLREMAVEDPHGEVRKNAQFFLHKLKAPMP